jgi:hypothetical protein
MIFAVIAGAAFVWLWAKHAVRFDRAANVKRWRNQWNNL